jgi:hypothetical protein
VNPPSETPGWYLQRPPVSGITRVESEGSWTGLAQLGNAQYPPHDGDLVDVAVSAAQDSVAKELMRSPGVVVEDQPIGIETKTATNVIVKLR